MRWQCTMFRMAKRATDEIVEESDVRVSVRLPAALSRRLDVFVARLQAKRRGARVKRSEGLRELLDKHLPAEE